MTPPAATAAGARGARVSRSRPAIHVPRRISAPRAPRRVSGPVTARPARERLAPVSVRLVEVIRTLPDRSLLDRIVRGRAWILVLGVMLAGIVAMQVELLKLNASIGRSLQLGAALQSRNDLLRASVSSLSDAQRIERLATGMGMVMAGPTSVQFLGGRPMNPSKAAANIHAPDAGTFQSALQAMLASAATNSDGGPSGAASGTSAAATGPAAAPASSTSGPATQSSPASGAAAPSGAGATSGGAAAPISGAATPTGRTVTATGGATSTGAGSPTGAASPTGVAGTHRATSTGTPSG
jgi:hypothetical protein